MQASEHVNVVGQERAMLAAELEKATAKVGSRPVHPRTPKRAMCMCCSHSVEVAELNSSLKRASNHHALNSHLTRARLAGV